MVKFVRADEWKPGVVLLAFMLYSILVLAKLISFTLSGLTIFLSFIILIAGINTSTNMKKITSLIIVCIWLIIASFAALTGFSGWVYFWMFSASIAVYLPPRDAAILIGMTALSIFTIQQTFIGFIILFTIFIFIYAVSKSYALGIVMWVPILIVGWFIGSGWGDIVTQKVDSIGTQISVDTGVSTESMFSGVSSALNNTWLLLTNPTEWYTKQFATEGNRDKLLTSSALEIVKIEALPKIMMPKDPFDVIFELENKGTNDAIMIKIGASGGSLAGACGKVAGKYCDPICIADANGLPDITKIGSLAVGCPLTKSIGRISPAEVRMDSFHFQAPDCPGTYSVGAGVKYEYTVDATLNLQMISRSYYNELLRNNKMKWIHELSTASAGPFKMTLRTDRQQPIPDTSDGNAKQIFNIYLGLVNEHVGEASLDHAVLKIPKELELVGWDDDLGKPDDGCSIAYEGSEKPLPYLDRKLMKTKDDYLKLLAEHRAAAEKKARDEGDTAYLSYRTVDFIVDDSDVGASANTKRKMAQNQWKYYRCSFRLVNDASIDQIQTYFIKATLPYTFTYNQQTSVTVRSIGDLPAKCKKGEASVVSPIDAAQTLPQAKENILLDLAAKLFKCRSNNEWVFFADPATCGQYKIDMQGCAETIINNKEIQDTIMNVQNEAYKSALDNTIIFEDELGKGLFRMEPGVTISGEDTIFDGAKIYSISMTYYAQVLWDAKAIGNYMVVRIASKPMDDPICIAPVTA